MEELKKKIDVFLKSEGLKNFFITNVFVDDNNLVNISITLTETDIKNFQKLKKILREKRVITEFNISDEIKKDVLSYLKFLIEIRMNDSFWKNVFENYEITKKENIIEVLIKNKEIIKNEKIKLFSEIFKKQTGKVLSFVSNEEENLSVQIIQEMKKNLKKMIRDGNNKNEEHIKDFFKKENGETVRFKGDIFFIESKKTKKKWTIYKIYITDYTDSIVCKFFATDKKKFEFSLNDTVEIEGIYEYDEYMHDYCVSTKKIKSSKIPLRELRKDEEKEKRIELHARTNMSEMCSPTTVKQYAQRAKYFGHKAMAVTDLGVVYSFPFCQKEVTEDFKVIYGVEAYMVDDENPVVENPNNEDLETAQYVVFDIETTGFDPFSDKIIEIGAVKIKENKIIEKFSHFVNPERKIPKEITELTTITDDMVKDAEKIETVLPKFLNFIEGSILVAHNAKFDAGFILQKAKEQGKKFKECIIDTLPLSRTLLPLEKRHSLSHLVKYFNVVLENHHRAIDDAIATSEIFKSLLNMLHRKGILKVFEINTQLVPNIKNAETLNTMILVKNKIGLKNLYELISLSHTEYFGNKRPRIPKSLLRKKREGLFIASSATASERNRGELINMCLRGAEKSQIEERAKFYDYIEIQPVSNYADIIADEETTEEHIKEINMWLCNLGEKNNVPVVAVGDMQYLDEEGDIYRNILMLGSGNIWKLDFKDRKLFYRTTEEMLKEFEYLGKEKAFEVTVTNTHKICDMIEKVRPVPEGFHPPEMKGASEEVRRMTYENLYKLYGKNINNSLTKRVEKELNAIINNGFSVLYLTAQKLVKKSNDLGYIVGSRGSVGSSIVAFLMGITEVNALNPHYRCPKCKNVEFMDFIGNGPDLPDKKCPVCGTEYIKDGHSIPFEVFMGFNGEKVPDIDLNFSGECQGAVQKYTEDLFGKENVFRAGTVNKLADQNAFGYVKKFMEEMNIGNKRNAELWRLALKCKGARKTSGQHPGGMIVIPQGSSVYDFCPVQKPANDLNSSFTTTHFEYHEMENQLVKLDMLGHDDPTMLKTLGEMTGVDIYNLPLDDKKVLSLFKNVEALNVSSKDIGNVVGTSGIPEFGTSFVKQMLLDTKPETFSELVRISGLSHGTNVWLNNAQDYVKEGIATLSEIISVRDDIMNRLIEAGMEKLEAFNIMEFVRKGKPKKQPEEWKKLAEKMKNCNIPEWYIESCEKIEYMFPKGHATAYVIMAVRIAWFKVYYPKEFYTAFLNRKADDFKLSTMFRPVEELKTRFESLETQGKLNPKEKQELFLYELLIEMYYRGIELEMVDLYKSNATKFEINKETGKIRMPFVAVDGLGITVAEKIVEERKEYEFLSVEDLKRRTKLNKTQAMLLSTHNCFQNLPETSQRTLF